MKVSIPEAIATHHFTVGEAVFEQLLIKNPHRLVETDFLFGGRRVRFRVVGSELAYHIGLPFQHLRSNGSKKETPHLTINLWDENETKFRSSERSRIPNPQSFSYSEFSNEGRYFIERLPNTIICFDRSSNRMVGSIAWGQNIFNYERGRPLSKPLLEWYNDLGIQVIHGGLVSIDGNGVFFVGKSGSGKSTSALACLCGGLNFLSEDYVGLELLSDGSFLGHSLYNSVFLETAHFSRFPNLLPFAIHGTENNENKSVVILSQVFPERLERVVPIKVLVLPRVVNRVEARFRPASKAETLLALGPSSLFQIPSRGSSSFPRLVQLIEHVPSYWLEIGRDIESIPRCVKQLMAEAVRP